MTDAEPQPPVVGGAEMRVNVAQAVMSGMTPAQLHLCLARPQVQLVMHDEDRIRCNAEEARERRHRAAGSVHERHRLTDSNVSRLRDLGREPRFMRERGAKLRGKRVGEPESRVVPRARVPTAW